MSEKVRFLVVDEDPTTEGAVSALCAQQGVEVEGAVNAVEAVSKATGSEYDVIIAHRYLQPIDGAALIDRLRKAGVRSAFIYLVDQSDPSLAAEALRLNVAGFLYKPLAEGTDNARTLEKTVAGIKRRRDRAQRAGYDKAEDAPSELLRLSEVSTGLKTMRDILQEGPATSSSVAQMVMVMVALKDPAKAKLIEASLPRTAIPRRANDTENVAEQARRLLSRVAVIESGFMGRPAFDLANQLRSMHPDLFIVVVGEQGSADEVDAIGGLGRTMYISDLGDPTLPNKLEAVLATLRKT